MKDIRTNHIQKEKTALYLALFLFQYSILIPLMSYINPSILVGVAGIALVVMSLIANRTLCINKKVLFAYYTIITVLILKIVIDGTDIGVLFYFCVIAVPVELIFSNEFDKEKFIYTCDALAVINFFVLFLNPFIGRYEYMRFGYGMLPTTIFSFVKMTRRNGKKLKLLYQFVFFASFVEIIMYGARGSVFSFAIFLLLFIFFIHRKSVLQNALCIIGATIAYLNIVRILELFQKAASLFGIYSYALRKYQMQFERGMISAASGRDVLYQEAIDKIKMHPIAGNPIVLSEEQGAYVHNLFLQVWQDLGIVAFLILILFFIASLTTLYRNDVTKEDKLILAVLFSLAFGRLMFSSVLWRRPEFWMLVCFQLSMKPVFRYSCGLQYNKYNHLFYG